MRITLLGLSILGSALLLLVCHDAPSAHAQKIKFGDEDDDSGLDILSDLASEGKEKDLEKIRISHLTFVKNWPGVRPQRVPKDVPKQTYHWAVSRYGVSPLSKESIATVVDVPEAGEYRLFFRQQLSANELRPVSMTLERSKTASLAKAQQRTFGKFGLDPSSSGKELEKKLPIRFESELQLKTFPDRQMMVWEYWDVKLDRGQYRLSLSSKSKLPQVDAVFLTRSKQFRPSFSYQAKDNTLGRYYMRFRVVETKSKAQEFSVGAGLIYHWRGRTNPKTREPYWGWRIGSTKSVPTDQWTPFLDAQEAIVPGPGPWSTCRASFGAVKQGIAEVQFAWHPHPAAVVHTVQTAIGNGRVMFRVPHGVAYRKDNPDKPSWGVWNTEHLDRVAPEEALVERYFDWASASAKDLGLAADHPKPRHLKILTGCRVGAAHQERAAEMLAKLGVNWIPSAPESVAKKYDLIDGSKINKVKTGDEISTWTGPEVINSDPRRLAEFHDYLGKQAKLEGMDLFQFLGVKDLRGIRCIDSVPENSGRFERRLFYHSHRFCHIATVERYARAVKNAEKKYGHAEVYNNYSPHPVFLTGRNMNRSDWFLLPRAGAQTLGWAEDWATGGSWGLRTNQYQCVSFYAALVDCSVRKRGYPSGFYVGSNCGGSAQKMFSCVGQGITTLHLYDWGPIDGWAEGSNAWSEMQGQYSQVMTGAHALGPADEIIGLGKREPRRTAILYNRSHEICSENVATLNHDWMWTFFALKANQIPVDVIIEEDLNAKDLDRYDALFLGGYNLEKRHLAAVRSWVEDGGLLVGTAGSAQYDVYNDPLEETIELFGAQQRLVGPENKKSRETVHFSASDFYDEAEFKPAVAAGRSYILTPTSGEALAHYDGGECAAVGQQLGKGKTVLLGFNTGFTYRFGGQAGGPVRTWLAAPVLRHLGTPSVQYDFPWSETTRFDHETGIVVLLQRHSPGNFEVSDQPGHLSVRTDRKIKQVVSGLYGPLKWKRNGENIEIETTPPAKLSVDTVILRD